MTPSDDDAFALFEQHSIESDPVTEPLPWRARVNVFEVALWVVGVVLIVVSVAGIQWAVRASFSGSTTCNGIGCSQNADFMMSQSMFSMAPPGFGAGLIALILAITLRALATSTARRGALTPQPQPSQPMPSPRPEAPISVAPARDEAEAVVDPGEPSAATQARFALPRGVARSPRDRSAFMRPRD